jgi:hypothetical protein
MKMDTQMVLSEGLGATKNRLTLIANPPYFKNIVA